MTKTITSPIDAISDSWSEVGWSDYPESSPRWFDHVLMTLVVWLFAGNPLAAGNVYRVGTPIVAIILLFIVLLRGASISKRQILVISVFVMLFAIQAIATDNFTLLTTAGFFARIMIALGSAILIRNFARAFIEVMFWTAVVSLPIYAVLIITQGGIVSFIQQYSIPMPDPDILVYYFSHLHVTQNNAYFWEPGVYGGYLILAIVFLGACKTQYTDRRYKMILFALLITLATTMSTGGYVTILFASLYHTKAFGKHAMIRIILMFVGVLGVVYIFESATFLGDKISRQFAMVEAQRRDWQLTRLGSILSDWTQIKVHPLIGWGPNPAERYGFVSQEILNGEGNGLSNFAAQFGSIGLSVFLLATWNGFKSLFAQREKAATLALIIVLLVLNDECFLNFPLFMALMFFRGPERALPLHDRAQSEFAARGRHAALGAVSPFQ